MQEISTGIKCIKLSALGHYLRVLILNWRASSYTRGIQTYLSISKRVLRTYPHEGKSVIKMDHT